MFQSKISQSDVKVKLGAVVIRPPSAPASAVCLSLPPRGAERDCSGAKETMTEEGCVAGRGQYRSPLPSSESAGQSHRGRKPYMPPDGSLLKSRSEPPPSSLPSSNLTRDCTAELNPAGVPQAVIYARDKLECRRRLHQHRHKFTPSSPVPWLAWNGSKNTAASDADGCTPACRTGTGQPAQGGLGL